MSRSLSDPLVERLLRSFPANRAYTRTDWADDAMPSPVAHFLNQLLNHHGRREARRLRRARTDWVNYDHPEMEEAVRTFFEAMETHPQVPASEWEDTLRKATRHAVAHLVRPADVLSNFVFGNQTEALPTAKVLWRMDFFGPYEYLREAVHAFAQKKDLDAFRPDRFEQFLYHMDERVTTDFDARRWLRLLEPLFKVARRATERERVPTALLQTFFDEKNATALRQRLRRHEAEGHDEVGPKTLYRLVDEGLEAPTSPEHGSRSPQEGDAPPTAEQAPDEVSPAASGGPPDDEVWGVAGPARPEGSDGPQPTPDGDESTPLWKQFQQGRTRNAASSADVGNQPLWARYRRDRGQRITDGDGDERDASGEGASAAADPDAVAEAKTSAPNEPDLQSLEHEILGTTDPPHRSVYVRQLFNGDQAAYREVLARLRSAESWGEASQIIASDVFRAYKVNIYSDAAVHFTNAVESRFRDE